MTCALCRKLDGSPPGGWVHRDDTWAVAMQDGYEVPGWIVLQTCRHVESTSALDDAEVSGLGPMLRTLTRAIEATVPGSDRVYVVGFREALPHWHLLLLPRTAGDDRRGGALLDARAELVDHAAATATARHLTELLVAG